ncbi:MAG: N-acetylmuramoyl-L-alanine amidase [Butyricicoccus sp.]
MEFLALLPEMGFLTSTAEEANLIDPTYQDKIAQGVAEALAQW